MNHNKTFSCEDVIQLISNMLLKHKENEKTSLLVAISGIDASGKSTLGKQISSGLAEIGINPALITLDDWHAPSSVRFSKSNSGNNYYQNAYRFNDLFNLLIDPLVQTRSICDQIDIFDAFTDSFCKKEICYQNIDVVILEGLFLLKKNMRNYNLSVWVECSFGTAKQRALTRNQERLSIEQLNYLYDFIYFPAQKIHLEQDNPKEFADLIFPNDDVTYA